MDAKKSFGWSKKLLILVACLPVGLAGYANWAGATSQPINYQRTAPALVFQQYLINLRNIPPSSQKYVYTRFVFKNLGTHPVKITELKPSCGCLLPKISKKEFMPGERGEFLVRVATATESPGKHDYFVTVKYTDPKPQETTVQFQFSLPEKQINIQPRALIFYQLNGEETTQEFVITDNRKKQMNVKNVTVSSNLVAAKIRSSELDDDGNRRVIISVTVDGKIPAGKHQAQVIVETDDPHFDKLVIPLWIQGATSTQAGKIKLKN